MNDSVRVTNMPDPGSKEAVALQLWKLLRNAQTPADDQLRFYVTCLNAVSGYPPSE